MTFSNLIGNVRALETTPKRLLLDLIATARDGAMPVRALVAAGTLFGIEEGSLRVALTRLGSRGLVEQDSRGCYRLAPLARPLGRHVLAWRQSRRRLRDWNGRWILVWPGRSGLARTAVRRQERALGIYGFATLRPGLVLRPDNLTGSIDETRRNLTELGLAPSALVCVGEDFDAATESHARGLWDRAALEEGYRASLARIDGSVARLEKASLEEGLVESYTLGGSILRSLLLDPFLPEELVDTEARSALLGAMVAYDRMGRALWSRFMRPYGVATGANPPAAAIDADQRAMFQEEFRS